MTIVVGVTAPDSLHLAADSRCTFGEEVVSDSVNKLFPICVRAGVAVYGGAPIGGRAIDALMEEFEASFGASGLTDVALPASLGRFFDSALGEAFTPTEIEDMTTDQVFSDYTPYTGFLVAYYDSSGLGQIGHRHRCVASNRASAPNGSSA